MSMDFIESLGEARMFKSREQIANEGALVMTEHLFISMLSLYAMSQDYDHAPIAAEYARRTISRGNFNQPSPSGTDLYQTIFTLQRPDELFKSEKDALLMGKVNLEEKKLGQFLRKIAQGRVTDVEASSFFYRLERNLKIQDPKLRAARRLIQDWTKLTTQQQQLAATQLSKHFRLHGRRSDIMPLFMSFGKNSGLIVGSGKLKDIAAGVAKRAALFGVGYAIGRKAGL